MRFYAQDRTADDPAGRDSSQNFSSLASNLFALRTRRSGEGTSGVPFGRAAQAAESLILLQRHCFRASRSSSSNAAGRRSLEMSMHCSRLKRQGYSMIQPYEHGDWSNSTVVIFKYFQELLGMAPKRSGRTAHNGSYSSPFNACHGHSAADKAGCSSEDLLRVLRLVQVFGGTSWVRTSWRW